MISEPFRLHVRQASILSHKSCSSSHTRYLCGALDIGLDGGFKSLGVCTNDLGDLLAILEEQESGHGTDAELLRNIGHLVNVKLVEACGGVCL